MAYLSMPSPDVFRQAIRSSVPIWYTVDASYNGSPVAGATGLQPIGGQITDTTKEGVRRTLSLELAPEPGLFDRLSPLGTLLSVTAHVQYGSREAIPVPMGVFDVDSEKITEGGGSLSITAPDRWAQIQRARFIVPFSSTPGVTIQTQIGVMIQGALGVTEPITDLSTRTALVGALTWEKDRDKAIIDLAKSLGIWVYFDRLGVCTIADIPSPSAGADWLVDASAFGVLTDLDRERSRAKTRNVIVVSSSASEGELFPTQIVWDDDPASPTYAGTDPQVAPETAGPFRIVPEFWDTPILDTVQAARQAGYSMLMRTTGLASQVSMGQVPNPAVDAFDALSVLAPQESPGVARVTELHIADTVTHPLVYGTPQHIDGRSTRTDDIVGGS